MTKTRRKTEMHLFLIGYRATGKSSVGQIIAERLKLNWIDSDDQVQKKTGKSIARIFEESGEVVFRELESEAIESICQLDSSSVVSLGGGAILREANRDLLKMYGKSIWLKAPAETIWRRISEDTKTAQERPNLTAKGGIEEIQDLLGSRQKLYQTTADFEIETAGKTTSEIAEAAIAYWNSIKL